MNGWYEKESLIKFESPCTITLISASNGGKTTFVQRLLRNSEGMFKEKFSKIIYCYGSTWQPIFDEMMNDIPTITFKEGLPTKEDLVSYTTDQKHTCLVLDDLMKEINAGTRAEKMWTV